MDQLQFFRDYSLTFKDDSGNETLTITNSHDFGVGLRVYFNISLNNAGDSSLSAATSSSHPSHFRIYNLSAKNHNLINNGTLNSISFSAGYRDKLNGGKSNKALLVADGVILNSVTYRQGTDIVTDIYTITSKQVADTKIDKEDQFKYRKLFTANIFYTQKEIFNYFISKYMPEAIVLPNNIRDLSSEKKFGFTFKAGTTVIQAITQICHGLTFYKDAIGHVHALSPKNYNNFANISSIVEVNQRTGLLGVPILSASGVISVNSLLNPIITPLSVVHISTKDGFSQTGVFKKISLLPISEQTARVLTVTFIGDSRGGAWQTRFTTNPTIQVTNNGN